jgi:hypothetical protein
MGIPADVIQDAVAFGVGVFAGGWLVIIGVRPDKWELETKPLSDGIVILAVKGNKKITLHKVGYDRKKSRDFETEFDEKLSEAVAHARSTINTLNAVDRKEKPNVGS